MIMQSILAMFSAVGLSQTPTVNSDVLKKIEIVSKISENTQLILETSKDFKLKNENIEVAYHYSHMSHMSHYSHYSSYSSY